MGSDPNASLLKSLTTRCSFPAFLRRLRRPRSSHSVPPCARAETRDVYLMFAAVHRTER
jgi:hypothetical protein